MGTGIGGTPPKKFSPSEEVLLIKVEGRVEELAGQQAEENKENREYRKRQIRYNRWVATFTGLLFLTSAVANLVGIFQLRQAQRSADATTVAAEAARKSANAAAESAKADAATAQAATDSVASSRDTLRFGQEAFRLEQRAWISLDTAQIINQMKAGETLTVELIIRNTGKTPANHRNLSRVLRRLPA